MKTKKIKIMKKLLLPLAIVAVFSACNSKKEEEKRDMLFLSDTSSLSNNTMSDTATITQAAPAPAAPVVQYTAPRPKRSTNTTYKKPVTVVTPTPEPTAPVTTVPSTTTGTTPAETGTAGTGTGETGTVDNTTTIPAKKEGISKAAKGAVIGGVAGAAAGAILGKNAKGAVIGGVIGAAGGYILGRKKDKADGRVGN